MQLVRKGVTQPGMFAMILYIFFRVDFVSCSGFVQTIKGEGMPIYGGSDHGDLFVEYNVVLPMEISPQTRRSKFLIFLLNFDMFLCFI